jgi:hypothetical protein
MKDYKVSFKDNSQSFVVFAMTPLQAKILFCCKLNISLQETKNMIARGV